MKILYFLFACSFFFFLSCEKDPNLPINRNLNLNTSTDMNVHENRNSSPSGHPSNQMIIRYKPFLTETERDLMRIEYGVQSYKNCTCADPTLELWIFSEDTSYGNGFNLEEKVITAGEDDDLEGADFNPIIRHTGQYLHDSFGSESIGVAIEKMVTTNENVTIAILDTGVDYNYFGFSNPFLYNNIINEDRCMDQGFQDYFGWDFVNQDNDPYDDYGHGTIVSSIIYNELTNSNVNFSILPIKTFDATGNGEYFDILCGFKYAVNKPNVDIVNMSFGWYNSGYDLLNTFITEAQDDFIINTSAGNETLNTDYIDHTPSTFDSENIISVAALSNNPLNIDLAWFSNYGTSTVDIAAKGENIQFYLNSVDYIMAHGTSFSCAYTSAFSGKLYTNGMSTDAHISAILNATIHHNNCLLYTSPSPRD